MTASPVLGAVHVLDLQLKAPPIRANDRDKHWAITARKKRKLRESAGWLARSQLKPIGRPVHVVLIWTVTDRRRRDHENLHPTMKASIDGIVDAGILPDDSTRFVLSAQCRIELGIVLGVRLELTEDQS